MNDAERERLEVETRRLMGDTLSLAAGYGIRLTNDEARIVAKILGDTLARTTYESLGRDIGSQEEFEIAAALYVRLGTALP